MRLALKNQLALLAIALFIGVGIALGCWQLRRADYKQQLAAAIASRSGQAAQALGVADPAPFTPVKLAGHWRNDLSVFIDNQVYQGMPGYYLITPLQLLGGQEVVAVVRGWLPANPHREILPQLSSDTALVNVIGQVKQAPPVPFQLAVEDWRGARWQYFNFAALQERLDQTATDGLYLRHFLVQQQASASTASDSGLKLVRNWPIPGSGVAMHLGYAFQWFGLALALAVYGVLFIRRMIRRE